MTRPATLASGVKSSVIKILDSVIKGLVLSDQTLNPSSLAPTPYMSSEPTPMLSWLEANSECGTGTNKTYDQCSHVPSSMQSMGPTFLSKLIQNAVTCF